MSSSNNMAQPIASANRNIWIIILVAAVVRFIYFLQYYSTPLFDVPMWDAEEYFQSGIELIHGRLHESLSYRPIFYPLLIGVVDLVFGNTLVTIRVLQVVLGIWSCVLVYKISHRLAGSAPALIAGLLAALTGMMVFFDLEISPTSIGIFFSLLGLHELDKTDRTRITAYKAGIYFGIAVLAISALVLPVLAVTLVLILRREYNEDVQITDSRLRNISALRGISFSAGWILPLMLSLVFRISAGLDTSLLAPGGGINFFVGNHPKADGFSPTLPGVGAGWNWTMVRQLAENETGSKMSATEVDKFYWLKTVRIISLDPLSWLAKMIRKGLLFWNRIEISNNQDIYYHAARYSMFGVLLYIGLPLLLPFALLGFYAGRANKVTTIILTFGITYYITIISFFVNSRFRQPVIPILCIMAGAGLVYGYKVFRDWRLEKVSTILVIAIVLIIGIVLPVSVNSNINPSDTSYGYMTEASALEKMGRFETALIMYKSALEQNPRAPYINFKVAEIFRQQGLFQEALSHYNKEIQIQPNYARSWNNRGLVHLQSGDKVSALQDFMKAASGNPPIQEACRNAARLWGELGQEAAGIENWASADTCFKMALNYDPENPIYQLMSIEADIINGDSVDSRDKLEKLRKKYPQFTPIDDLLKKL